MKGWRLSELYGGLVTAVRTLSILPLPGRDAQSMASALPWFPLVGCVLGFMAYGCAMLASCLTGSTWPELAAFTALGAGIILTRGLHLDGLSDWADGFGSIADRERTLDIMKDPRVGVFGALALIVVLLGKWLAITRLFTHGGGTWLAGAFTVSRSVVVLLAVWLPYARPQGGTAAPFVSAARPVHFVAAILVSSGLLLALGGWKVLLLLGAGMLAGSLFGISCRRRLGGVTGDLLGAACEMVELAMLVLADIMILQP